VSDASSADGPEVVGPRDLNRLFAALDRGEVVGLPTDTVYGLAARIDRPEGLARIFEAKGRPADLALPVLIGRTAQVHDVASTWPAMAKALADRMWPGPLTLVVPAGALGRQLGGDGSTVGLREPKDRWLRSLLRKIGPLAVTSANAHGRPPATTSADAAAAFDPALVAMIMEGGTCDGVPSTVVDCTGEEPRCLREGGVAWERIEAAIAMRGLQRRWFARRRSPN
jgi:L-threonylcarbamoyladenylate synthase